MTNRFEHLKRIAKQPGGGHHLIPIHGLLKLSGWNSVMSSVPLALIEAGEIFGLYLILASPCAERGGELSPLPHRVRVRSAIRLQDAAIVAGTAPRDSLT